VIVLLLPLLLVYALSLFWMAIGFIRSKYFVAGNNPKYLPVSIIICARNEATNITSCLKSLLAQHYDLTKIQLLLINDASADNTLQLAQEILSNSGIDYRIISNTEQLGKKQSISLAMQHTKHELIITRDADTVAHSPLWMRTFVEYYTATNAGFIIGPIALADSFSLLWALQAIENNVLAVLNCGSAYYKKPFLCSGANLAFTKTTFQKTNGYAAHMNVASGDDVLFLEDVKKLGQVNISYLKSVDAVVHTYAAKNVSELLSQKTRWASKFKINPNRFNFYLSVLIFLVNLSFVFCVLQLLSGSGREYFLFVILKLCIDILLLFLASGFIKNKFLPWFILPVAFLYPLYVCLVSIATLFIKPKWKN